MSECVLERRDGGTRAAAAAAAATLSPSSAPPAVWEPQSGSLSPGLTAQTHHDGQFQSQKSVFAAHLDIKQTISGSMAGRRRCVSGITSPVGLRASTETQKVSLLKVAVKRIFRLKGSTSNVIEWRNKIRIPERFWEGFTHFPHKLNCG